MSEFQSLGEMASAVNEKITIGKDPEKPYVGLENLKPRSGGLNGYSASGTSISTNSVFEAHDVLFGKLRPNLRKCISAPFSGYCSTDILVLRANEGFHPEYVAKTFQSELVGRAAEGSAVGTKMPRTSWRDLKGLRVFTPSLPEQRLVAHILDTLDTQIQKTEALIAKLEKVKEGLLHDLLTRGIDENGHLRPSPEQAPELYKESPLGLIPREWEVNKIKDISTKVTNGFVGVATPHYTESQSGAIYLYGNNIRKNRIDLSKHERVTQTFHKSQVKSQLKDGDMLTVQSGHIGTSAVYELSMGEANCHALIITRFAPSLVKSRFASLYLNSKLGMLAQRRLFIGSTILHINTSDLAKLAIPTPSLDEQNRVVEHFEKIEDRLQRETRERDNLVKLKQGLMDDLLTGRVRVTPLLNQTQATPPGIDRGPYNNITTPEPHRTGNRHDHLR